MPVWPHFHQKSDVQMVRGWMDECMDKWMDAWMDRCMEVNVEVNSYKPQAF